MTTHPLRRPALSVLALALALSGMPLHAQDLPMPATRSRAPVTLNFVNADIEMVTRAIGAMLNRQIIVDPRVRGQITLTSERAQPPQEAWRSYLAALRGLGFTVVDVGGMLKVVPEAEAKFQAGTVVTGAPSQRGDVVVTQIFRLSHENPNNLVPILRGMISANNLINANPATSSLIITDYADNLQRIAKVIAALDQPAASDVEVIPLTHALASDIAPLVQRLSDSGGGMAVPGAAPAAATATSILTDPRSNALIVRAANPARLAQIKSLVDKLDRPVEGGGPAGRIWVVYLRNADAVKLAEVLRASLAAGMAGSGQSGAASPMPVAAAPAPRPAQPPVGGIAGASVSAGGASTAATTPVSQSAGPSTGGQIQADPASNSLIISAPEPVYRQLRQVIDQLDTRRAQIYVESLIVKVDAQRAADMGIQWQGLLANGTNTAGIIGGTNFGTQGNNILNLTLGGAGGATASIPVPGPGLNIGLVQKIQGIYTLTGLARFLESTTGANVLSTPTLMALDNEEAKIVVGQNVPFITGSFTNTGAGSGSANPFQTIERKDVGLTLRVKSQVGEGGTVRMTIYQENSNVTGNAPGGAGLITDKSAVETSVVVNDGQMLVLGGLMRDEYTDGEDRVPGLSAIPLVGNLFKSQNRRRIKSNLMVFLRPVVMRDQLASDQLTVNRYESIRALQQDSQPEPNLLSPVNEAPVVPELPPSMQPARPEAAPPEPVPPAQPQSVPPQGQ